jgi:hypothetical protein
VDITRNWEWDAFPYNGRLPPPLCFTVPAGSKVNTSKVLVTGGHAPLILSPAKLMMDPSDPSTWQRTYKFS